MSTKPTSGDISFLVRPGVSGHGGRLVISCRRDEGEGTVECRLDSLPASVVIRHLNKWERGGFRVTLLIQTKINKLCKCKKPAVNKHKQTLGFS